MYNPEQPIFIGSGEEGAYGAGVGALASLLIDMTIGRRARLAGGIKDGTVTPSPGAAPSAVEPPGTSPTLLLGYDDEGRIARARQEDIRTSDPLAQLSPFERNLARTGKEAALEETFKSQEPDLLGDVLPPKETISEPEEAVATPDTQTRDMIDESETAQLEEMQRVEAIAPVVGERNEAEIQKVGQSLQ